MITDSMDFFMASPMKEDERGGKRLHKDGRMKGAERGLKAAESGLKWTY